jgi:hypothetical protein
MIFVKTGDRSIPIFQSLLPTCCLDMELPDDKVQHQRDGGGRLAAQSSRVLTAPCLFLLTGGLPARRWHAGPVPNCRGTGSDADCLCFSISNRVKLYCLSIPQAFINFFCNEKKTRIGSSRASLVASVMMPWIGEMVAGPQAHETHSPPFNLDSANTVLSLAATLPTLMLLEREPKLNNFRFKCCRSFQTRISKAVKFTWLSNNICSHLINFQTQEPSA